MNPSTSEEEVVHDYQPFFRIYKDGRTERFFDTPLVPPSEDPQTGVQSKDVVISPEPKVSARLFLPKTTDENHRKLPLLFYIHGGGFSIESAFSTIYHSYLNSLVAAANVVAVSIEYRRAPEHRVPACYDDSWTALKWVAQHREGKGPDPWLNDHADFGRIFLAGDSAGANIAHYMVVRASEEEGGGVGLEMKIEGLALIHPFFGNDKPDRIWNFICPDSSGLNDPRLNPGGNPDVLAKLRCEKVLVVIASKDFLRDRGWNYYEALKKSEWGGVVEVVEIEDEEHVFHLMKPNCENAGSLMNLMVSFLNHQNHSSSSSSSL